MFTRGLFRPQLNYCIDRITKRFNYTYIKVCDLNKNVVGDKIQVKGWVHNFRKQGKHLLFIDLKDGSSNEHLQVTVDGRTQPQLPALGYGDAIIVTGKIGTAPRGHLELCAESLKLKGTCPTDDGFYPFVRKENTTLECIRQHLHLRAHGGLFQAIFRARHLATQAFYQYFNENRFTHIHTPILSSNSCEGAGELFTVRPQSKDLLNTMQSSTNKRQNDEIYFNRNVFLTLSGQMHLEAMCYRLGSVYNFGPVFRAENSLSTIHMSEFYMIEAEESFIDSIDNITRRIESTIKTVTNNLLENHAKDLNEVYTKYSSDERANNESKRFDWLQKPFKTITYAEAAEILQKQSNFNQKLGLSKSDELHLVDHLQSPVFVIDWPNELKPFYMRTCKHDAKLVEAVDLLMPMVGELAGGSVREDNYDILKNSIPSGNSFEWYLDLRKYGGCTTGGFGIGFDRYLQILCGITNIKDTIPFPRWPHHCTM